MMASAYHSASAVVQAYYGTVSVKLKLHVLPVKPLQALAGVCANVPGPVYSILAYKLTAPFTLR